jgi:hypothetical protein
VLNMDADELVAMANTKLQEVAPLRQDRPDIAQVIAAEALTLATMANAQATIALAQTMIGVTSPRRRRRDSHGGGGHAPPHGDPRWPSRERRLLPAGGQLRLDSSSRHSVKRLRVRRR